MTYLQIICEVMNPLSIQKLSKKQQQKHCMKFKTFIASYIRALLREGLYLSDDIRGLQFPNGEYVLGNGSIKVTFAEKMQYTHNVILYILLHHMLCWTYL